MNRRIPIICHTDGRRFTIAASALTPDLRCACGSADIDLDEGLEATAASEPTQVSVMLLAQSLRIQPEDVWAVLDSNGSDDRVARALRIQPEDVRVIRNRFGKTKGASKSTTASDTGWTCSVCGKPATHRQTQPHSVHYVYRCAEHASGNAEKVGSKSAAKTLPPWVGRRQASFETDPEMGQVGTEPDAVKQQVTCSSCLTDHVVTATDPAQPMPPCPSCGALTLSPGGSTLASRKTAGGFQEAVRQGLMMGMSEFLNPGAMLPSSVYVVMKPGPNGAVPTDRKTSDRDEANRWAQELLDQYPNGFPRVTSRRDAKIAEIVAGIRATNPGMPPQIAHRVAVQTIRRFPSILGN